MTLQKGTLSTQALTASSYAPQALTGTCLHPENCGAGIQVNVCFPTGAAGPCLHHSPDLTDEPLNTGTKADLGRPPGWCVCSVVEKTGCSQPCYRQAAERGMRGGWSRAPSQMRAQASLGRRSYSTSRNSRESHMAAAGVCVCV